MKYSLTNHLCRYCGSGRILINSENNSYFCSSCEVTGSAICWCGKTLLRHPNKPYKTLCVCLDDKENVENLKKDFWHQKTPHYKLAVFWKCIAD